MQSKDFILRIESIFGGISKSPNFSAPDEFMNSVGVDPDQSDTHGPSSGFLVPVMVDSSTASSKSNIMWFVLNPKDDNIYAYDAVGSVFTSGGSDLVPLGDLNDGGNAYGNGAAYYDNYIYFARATTIARYGPLDGTPAFTDDYWVGTLGKTALSDTSYPFISASGNIFYPNHVMHRHSDGKLYFADVVGNQGVLHCISTTKTTVEGDTDNGSKYNAIDFPFGMYPTSIESYGTNLAVSLFEGKTSPTNAFSRGPRAKVSFWDTINPNTYDFITDEELPDPFISALLNTNGILYAFSGENGQTISGGVRISRYIGGYTSEQVSYLDKSFPPFPGAVDGILNKIIFGGDNSIPCVWSIGSKQSPVSNKIFNIIRCSGSSSVIITALKYANSNGFSQLSPIMGVGDGVVDSGNNHLDYVSTAPANANTPTFSSRLFRIGLPFKIKKIRMPLVSSLSSLNSPANNSVTPSLTFDLGSSVKTLTTINNTNYPTEKNIIIRPENAVGKFSFVLNFDWNIKETFPFALPITIEGEYLDD